MATTTERVAGLAICFVLIFLLGIWLSRFGRPYNVVALTIHKLISLAGLVLLGVTVVQANQVVVLGTAAVIASVATVVLFVIAIISGGLVSMDRRMPRAVRATHWVTPFLTLLATEVTLCLLRRNRLNLGPLRPGWRP